MLMFTKTLIVLLFTVSTLSAIAQQNFTYSPANPKPGDKISFTYIPGGDIANTSSPVEGVVYQQGNSKQKADDIVMEKQGNSYTGSFVTDTAMNFVYLGFTADKKFDNNNSQGFFINLYENGQVRKGSYMTQSMYYQFLGGQVGLDRNNDKALESMESEFKLYPESRKQNLISYLRLQASIKKDASTAILQKEIESQLKAGLKEEMDYDNVINMYSLAKLPEQAKLITGLKKEKFPNGNWTRTEKVQKFMMEQDPAKKETMLKEIMDKAETDKDWGGFKQSIPFFKTQMASAYLAKKDYDKFKEAVKDVTDKAQLASLYNNTAWEMQKTSDNLAMAEEMSRFAADYFKQQWKNPTDKRPEYMTEKQWKKNIETSYAMYADTYAMVMYRMGNYKKGYAYTKDAAIVINKGEGADYNGTYALLAEKVLPAKKLKAELEKFVTDGKSNSDISEVLKRTYIKERKSDAGFDTYLSGLQSQSREHMLAELQKSMMDEAAPSFALFNLDGNKVDINELKGKTVVVDFWATWCGPCKASFPGMQKMVAKYKNNPDVKFVFVDTWETADNKKKNASDFIAANKYSFDVLLDNDNKVVEQFKVDGIPTKFIIDKDGKIRFKSVGFSGSDEKLVDELTAMIDIVSNPSKKAF